MDAKASLAATGCPHLCHSSCFHIEIGPSTPVDAGNDAYYVGLGAPVPKRGARCELQLVWLKPALPPRRDKQKETHHRAKKQQAQYQQDRRDQPADTATLGHAFAFGIHTAGTHRCQIVVAHDPGKGAKQEGNITRKPQNQTENAEGQDCRSAMRQQIAAAPAADGSGPRISTSAPWSSSQSLRPARSGSRG